VYDTVELELENGEVVLIKPLPIKALRKFMDVISQAGTDEAESETQLMDTFIEACTLCLKALHPVMFEKMTQADIEELVTLPTIMKILEVAGGLKTTDPNLLGAAVVGMN
jgi:hypothetical protein